MATATVSRRGRWLGVVVLLGAATAAYAQFGGAVQPAKVAEPPVMEFTEQEVLANQLIQTLNDLSKQHWEVFQIVPAWAVRNQNGEAELVPRAYEVFGRRPVAPQK
ncbi:MAG: hypothetical protein P4L84_22940 [Isosphaeraceae bacterium]|nr:hypothetical protein [Isosphaeraceae bacterium]